VPGKDNARDGRLGVQPLLTAAQRQRDVRSWQATTMRGAVTPAPVKVASLVDYVMGKSK
jgi:hypothetical protein